MTDNSMKEQLADIENEKVPADSAAADETRLNLLDMPVEIILKICSFLDAYFLKNTFGKVCQRLEDILSDDNLWKYWVHSRIKGCYPPILEIKIWDEEPINWVDVCADMDFERNKWTNSAETVKHIVVKEMHYASVDAVLLVNKGELCVSGGRDRSMAILNISDIMASENGSEAIYPNSKLRQIREDAHTGWVWDLSPDYPDSASIVYSASWDNSEVIAGLYSQKVLMFDLRAGTAPTSWYKPHKGPILGMHKHNDLVASISDDKTMAIWDRVAGKILKSDIKMPIDKAYPVCISWSPSALYVGDSRGSLHLFHPEKFTYLKSHELWEQPPIIKPCNKLCYQNGVLCVGTCDSALEFWVPDTRF
ncbi:putative WD-repeat protein [Operophtera brumata]|uniref:Putative WD-repeat protein n=1 Tax=Operophtera brumata TaxID=104452 RepID=A0A0L7LLE1_OPEBR|nr:putative WD-repeat protein [Operophtera brumata]